MVQVNTQLLSNARDVNLI